MKRLVVLAIALAACKRGDTGEDAVVTSATCIRCDAPHATGKLGDDALDETSGLAASSRFDDVWFVNNDSGDTARFFAIDGKGKRLATFTFGKAPVVDCEDMARGPCAPDSDRSCLYVGDIGDNAKHREKIVVYRVPEPGAIEDAALSADAFALTYPDGPHNAETLLAHPRTGTLTIVTKEDRGASTIYEAPSPLAPGVLKKVGTIRAPAGSPRFTGGDVHPSGKGILLRTYTHVFFAPMRPDQSIADALTAPLCSLPVAREEQGEAVGWTKSGDGFVTISEGEGAPVNAVHCAAP